MHPTKILEELKDIATSSDQCACGHGPEDAVTVQRLRTFIKKLQEEDDEQKGDLAEKYRRTCAEANEKEGECEIDPSSVVSFGDDAGAYVETWLWVAESDLS